jgi:hypothetical protein
MIIPHPQPHTPDPSPSKFSTNKSLKIKNEKKIGALHRHMEDLVLGLPDFRRFNFMIISRLKT